ncbi:MAG: phosphatidate cytidylyltransferase [Gallionella sp.]
MLKLRVITAIILLVAFLSAVFMLPMMGWAMLVLVIVLQGAYEWAKLSKLTSVAAVLYVASAALLLSLLIWTEPQAGGSSIKISIYIISALLWFVIVPVWMIRGWKVEQTALMMLVGWAVLIPTGLAMLDLRVVSPWLLLAVMALVWVADSAAYFTGRKFGKHKLAPGISPGKTWEGVAGAVAGVFAYVLIVWNLHPDFLQNASLPKLLLASIFWVALAVIGDLFESAIKRQAGVKDSGALLPGHGGLLDRIDALTSTLPLAALVLLLSL